MNLHQRRSFKEQLLEESDRIVSEGGKPIPVEIMAKCWDLMEYSQRSLNSEQYTKEIVRLVEQHRQDTVPALIKERHAKLKAALMRSSNLTRLRQRRGLPFKSSRQP